MRPLTFSASVATAGTRGEMAANRIALRPDEVDVWCASLDGQRPDVVQSLHALLSRDELARVQSFHFERDRCRYVVGRGLLRTLLGRYLDLAPADLRFQYGPAGKPALADDPKWRRGEAGSEKLHFNVAHSEGLALFAFTTAGRVGIDLEFMRELPEWERVAESAFSAHELKRLRACSPERRRDEFFRAWTRQEAVLKAMGAGLGDAAALGNENGFTVYPLEPEPRFAAALATVPAAKWASFHRWPDEACANEARDTLQRRGRISLENLTASQTTFL